MIGWRLDELHRHGGPYGPELVRRLRRLRRPINGLNGFNGFTGFNGFNGFNVFIGVCIPVHLAKADRGEDGGREPSRDEFGQRMRME